MLRRCPQLGGVASQELMYWWYYRISEEVPWAWSWAGGRVWRSRLEVADSRCITEETLWNRMFVSLTCATTESSGTECIQGFFASQVKSARVLSWCPRKKNDIILHHPTDNVGGATMEKRCQEWSYSTSLVAFSGHITLKSDGALPGISDAKHQALI